MNNVVKRYLHFRIVAFYFCRRNPALVRSKMLQNLNGKMHLITPLVCDCVFIKRRGVDSWMICMSFLSLGKHTCVAFKYNCTWAKFIQNDEIHKIDVCTFPNARFHHLIVFLTIKEFHLNMAPKCKKHSIKGLCQS